MGQVVQFPSARARRQARADQAADPAPAGAYSGALGAWLAMIEIHFRAWRTFGRSLAPSDEVATSRREKAGLK